ncbi:MAG: hypothetical protein P4L50_20130 [Anaerolineaceae bacterium]|nr:hypothetical protein [Anaerolineaceae bacterium]
MTIWDLDIALQHIKQHFGFLFMGETKILHSDFPDHFDNFIVILEKPEFRIRFTRDRSSITMQIGTHQAGSGWSTDGWYELTGIIMYLTSNQIMIVEYENTFDSDLQLERLAKVFVYYYDQIVDLFRPENFSKQKEKLWQVILEAISIIVYPVRKDERKKLMKQTRNFWQSIGVSMENNDRNTY